MSRKQIDKRVLVTQWDDKKNKPFTKRGIKPTLTKEGKSNCFSIFLRAYCEDSPMLLGEITTEMNISNSSMANYLYRGFNPSYANLMQIVHIICKHTKRKPIDVLAFLYENWELNNEK
jgi:predicted transcriptional regulator